LVELDDSVVRSMAEASAAKAASNTAIEAAQATVEYRQLEYERARELHGEGAVPQSHLDEAKVALRLAKLQLEQAKLQKVLDTHEARRHQTLLEKRTVRARFAGYVAKQHYQLGEAVDEYQPVTRLVAIDPLRIIAHVPAKHRGTVTVGDRAELRLKDPDRTFACEVFFVDQVVDAGSGTFRVKLRMPNKGFKVAPGLHGTVRFKKALTAVRRSPEGESDGKEKR
jgi:RND family efflux transporter MFP subunit